MTKARDIASAIPAPSTVDATELGYLDGVTSAIQTQLDAKTAKSTLTTTGDIYYASAANTPARLAIGSTSNVLTVAGGVPTWAAPAAGGMTLLSTTSLSGATTTISSISGSYKNLIILIKDFYASSNFDTIMGVNGDNTAANYQQIVVRSSGSSDGTFATNADAGAFISGYQVANTQKNNLAVITIADYANATTNKVINILCNAESPTAKTTTNTTCSYSGTVAAISEINVKTTVGTWSAGSVEIYGVN